MRDDRKKSQAAAEDDRRIAILRPHLDGNAPLARVASNAGVPLRTERTLVGALLRSRPRRACAATALGRGCSQNRG